MTPSAPTAQTRVAISVPARKGEGLVEGFQTDFAMYESPHVFEVVLEVGQLGQIGGRHRSLGQGREVYQKDFERRLGKAPGLDRLTSLVCAQIHSEWESRKTALEAFLRAERW